MSWFSKIIENIKGSEDFSELKSSSFRDILNGNIFTKRFFIKQIGLLIMIVVLFIFYIGNRYEYESELTYQNKLKKEVQDKKYESLSISAELMQVSRQSNVEKMLKERGIELHEPVSPLVVLDDSIQ
ncbi:MAG TPA: FtsL-like putative cell division protein [Paludibacteraceae bacterium]|jgi:hypothetical protein|nr:hypothetical protein [Paludibacteraceae bacterium]OPZ01957.1 MAG: hypothetical protein BWZ11_01296 [Bacteroidetes bacterium ADurb.BinA395]MBP8965982.1 hypothetical protein [Paludibacteraceae bacterium]HOF97947.1 FtsL-like putative cell division protein [Paludibacteraceae bacterium]HOJ66198.1 FtsL-like putative cell division protein [Paludibacteraceae bacterium]